MGFSGEKHHPAPAVEVMDRATAQKVMKTLVPLEFFLDLLLWPVSKSFNVQKMSSKCMPNIVYWSTSCNLSLTIGFNKSMTSLSQLLLEMLVGGF